MSKIRTLKEIDQPAAAKPSSLLHELSIPAPAKSITETLDEWVDARNRISVLEAKRREIEPMAIAQLKDLLSVQGKEKGAGYEVNGHMVILKTVKAKESEIDGLEAIDHEIQMEKKRFDSQPEIAAILAQAKKAEDLLKSLNKEYMGLIVQDTALADLHRERQQLIDSTKKEVLELRQVKSSK